MLAHTRQQLLRDDLGVMALGHRSLLRDDLGVMALGHRSLLRDDLVVMALGHRSRNLKRVESLKKEIHPTVFSQQPFHFFFFFFLVQRVSKIICDRAWEKGPIDVVDYFLLFYTFGTCASLPYYGYLSERYKCFRR